MGSSRVGPDEINWIRAPHVGELAGGKVPFFSIGDTCTAGNTIAANIKLLLLALSTTDARKNFVPDRNSVENRCLNLDKILSRIKKIMHASHPSLQKLRVKRRSTNLKKILEKIMMYQNSCLFRYELC